MPLTPGSTSNSGSTALYNNTGGSWNHTTTAGENSLWVHIGMHNADVTGVTFNGDALTQAALATDGTYKSYLFYIVSPDIGTYSISVTYNGTGYGSGGAIAFSGTNTSSPLGVTGTATGSGTNPNKTVTTTTDNSYVLQGIYVTGEASPNSIAPGASETEFYEVSTANFATMQASHKVTTTAGSYSMSETSSVSVTSWEIAVIEIKASISIDFTSTDTATLTDSIVMDIKSPIDFIVSETITLTESIINTVRGLWRFKDKNDTTFKYKDKNDTTWKWKTK